MRKCTIIIHSSCKLLLTYLGQSLLPCCSAIYHTQTTHETLSLNESIHPDLIIVISTSPLLKSPQLIQGLRGKSTHRPQIFVITWQLSEQVVIGLLEMGIDQYMTFPISVERLRSKVTAINYMLSV